MKNNRSISLGSYISAFLIGVLLLLSFGKEWLNFESALVFLAGLVGVMLPVLFFGMWNVHRNNREN